MIRIEHTTKQDILSEMTRIRLQLTVLFVFVFVSGGMSLFLPSARTADIATLPVVTPVILCEALDNVDLAPTGTSWCLSHAIRPRDLFRLRSAIKTMFRASGLPNRHKSFPALCFYHIRSRRQSLTEEQRMCVTKRKLGSIDVQSSQIDCSPFYRVPYREAAQATVIRK